MVDDCEAVGTGDNSFNLVKGKLVFCSPFWKMFVRRLCCQTMENVRVPCEVGEELTDISD